jgi:hydroxymethylpyrimidine pyrophosphatase-like HAD family hydrolase
VWRTAAVEDLEEYETDLITYMRNEGGRVDEGKTIQALTIISGFGDYRYIDFTPLEGGKYSAVLFAQKALGFSADRTLVAGDSGNDVLMFKNGEHGVIVSNHTPEVTQWLDAHSKELTNKYISELKYADAVVEALERLTS